jgi:hypothetical protein
MSNVNWVELRPYLFSSTNLTYRISVYKKLDRDFDVIYMSLDQLNLHNVRLKSSNFELAKIEALSIYKKYLLKLVSEFDDWL